MQQGRLTSRYSTDRLLAEASRFLSPIARAASLDEARARLSAQVSMEQFDAHQLVSTSSGAMLHVVRDCARALRGMLNRRAEERSGFSVAQALWDLAAGRERPDLQAGFLAELTHLVMGLEGRLPALAADQPEPVLEGRAAARRRSDLLDQLWAGAERVMERYSDGLAAEARQRRKLRQRKIAAALGGSEAEFADWTWQVSHIARDEVELQQLAPLSQAERDVISRARGARLPFGVTPYYASLLDEEPGAGRDRALRAQIIPSADYLEAMLASGGRKECAFDFMLERDTSPIDLLTRRYPAIAILKPFNTCPQICVYCQRNWEIEEAMAEGALASDRKLERAIEFLAARPAIKEVLVTGGDPLGLPDQILLDILGRLAAIPHLELIRIGTRTPVTLPMRITPELAAALGSLREPGRRELAVVTHVEHPYEITPELVTAVDRLKRTGISVYNQLVFTFFVSRRFEASRLRLLLRRAGIDPYYTFIPKGKEETRSYRVPLARLLQEQNEEARLLPGLRRSDEAVFNVPGLGKNYLRASQHRDLICVLPDGSRMYDFHPWEKGIAECEPHVSTDVPILGYLQRLEELGEDPDDYGSIWYYF